MSDQVIFEVATRPFEWASLEVPIALFILGCLAIVSERFKLGYAAVKNVGYVVASVAVLFAGFLLADWYFSRRDRVRVLTSGQYEVVLGTVEKFQPANYGRSNEESFTIAGHTFRYSDYKSTVCFNRTSTHGGAIRAGMSLRIFFVDDCILRIESVQAAAP